MLDAYTSTGLTGTAEIAERTEEANMTTLMTTMITFKRIANKAKWLGMALVMSCSLGLYTGHSGTVTAAPSQVEVPELNLKGAPDKLIESATNALIKELLIGSKLSGSKQVAYYRDAVEQIVAPLIDFELIAKRVMSKHYRLATPEQRQQFATVFRESLLETYTKGITGYSDEEIKFLPFAGTKVSKKSKVERASVEMEIRTKEGNVLPVVYQVYKNKEGEWKLENLILSGVNLGLTFRNQFNESLKSKKGNIDQVIKNWNVDEVAQTAQR